MQLPPSYLLLPMFFILWIFVPFLPSYLAYKFLPGEIKFGADEKVTNISINATGGIAIYIIFLYLAHTFFFNQKLDEILGMYRDIEKARTENEIFLEKERNNRILEANTECTYDVYCNLKVRLKNGEFLKGSADDLIKQMRVRYEPSNVVLQGSLCKFKLYSSTIENRLGTIFIESAATVPYHKSVGELFDKRLAKVSGSEIFLDDVVLDQAVSPIQVGAMQNIIKPSGAVMPIGKATEN